MTAAIWVWTVEVVPVLSDDAAESAALPDITGYEVSATDGNVGKVEEVVTDSDGRTYLVVDTGFWIFGKKRMIPAGVVDTIDHENRKVSVRLTKDEIKKAPDYDEKRRGDAEVRKSHEEHYGPFARKRT